MEDKDFNEICEYALWKGLSSHADFKKIILHLDKAVADYDFTLDLVKNLIKSLYSDTEGYYEDKKDLDEVLKDMIKEISEDFEPCDQTVEFIVRNHDGIQIVSMIPWTTEYQDNIEECMELISKAPQLVENLANMVRVFDYHSDRLDSAQNNVLNQSKKLLEALSYDKS